MDTYIQKTKNFNSFDLSKFVASILVVMIHIAPFGSQQTQNVYSQMNFLLKNGICRIAVPLFFIFSGFFLYRKTPLDRFSLEPTKKYFLHILKLYLLWTLIYFPLAMIGILNNPNGILFGFIMYVRNSIFSGSFSQLWYLNGLLFAVFLISFLLYKKWSPKKILITSSVFYIMGLFGDAYHGLISPLFDTKYIGTLLNLYFTVFGTTRNGLFFGFFFVSMGMVFSNKDFLFSQKKSLLLFMVSIIILYLEVFLLTKFNIAKDYNILLSTVPAAIFCFLFLKSTNLKDNKIYKYLRLTSSMTFYGHQWISFLVMKISLSLGYDLIGSPAQFIITLVSTIILGFAIIKLSERRKFVWLKNIY